MKLIDALKQVREIMCAEDNSLREFGVCYAVEQQFNGHGRGVLDASMEDLHYLAMRYVREVSGEYGGTHGFPVHGGVRECMVHDDMWDRDTEYGRHRWAYLDWLIQQLEDGK